MDFEQQFGRLISVLESQAYQHLDRLTRLKSILDIQVQDFFCIVAFIGNIALLPFARGRNVFPPVYRNNTTRVSREDQGKCLETILKLSEKLNLSYKTTKTQILSNTERYGEIRAEFIIRLLDYMNQIKEPPHRPRQLHFPNRVSLMGRSASYASVRTLGGQTKALCDFNGNGSYDCLTCERK